MDSVAPPSEFSRVRRLPARAAYDKATVHGILDAAMIEVWKSCGSLQHELTQGLGD